MSLFSMTMDNLASLSTDEFSQALFSTPSHPEGAMDNAIEDKARDYLTRGDVYHFVFLVCILNVLTNYKLD